MNVRDWKGTEILYETALSEIPGWPSGEALLMIETENDAAMLLFLTGVDANPFEVLEHVKSGNTAQVIHMHNAPIPIPADAASMQLRALPIGKN